VFDGLPANFTSGFCAKAFFDWSGKNELGWVGRCRDWVATVPQVRMSKKPAFKANTEII